MYFYLGTLEYALRLNEKHQIFFPIRLANILVGGVARIVERFLFSGIDQINRK